MTTSAAVREVHALTLEQQVALYSERLNAYDAVFWRMASRATLIISREEWIAANQDAPSLKLVQGIVDQAEAQQSLERTQAMACALKVGEVLRELTDSEVFWRDYQLTVLRIPGGLSLNGVQIDLWDWERRPEAEGTAALHTNSTM